MDHGINYKTHDVVQEVMRLTDKKGVDLVVDRVGGSTLQGSILSLGYRGRVSMVGAAGREPMKVDVSSLMGGNRTLQGVFLGAEIGTRPRLRQHPAADQRGGARRAEGGDRPHLPALRSRRGARLHREPPGGRAGCC